MERALCKPHRCCLVADDIIRVIMAPDSTLPHKVASRCRHSMLSENVMDDTHVYGVAAKPPHMCRDWLMSWHEYQLFAMPKQPQTAPTSKGEDVHFT